MANYHKTVEKIIQSLRESNCWYETFEHEPVRTSEEAAKLRRGYSLHQGAKALIIRAKIPNEGKQFLMVVLPGDTKFDNEKVKALLGAKDTRFATEEEVQQLQKGYCPVEYFHSVIYLILKLLQISHFLRTKKLFLMPETEVFQLL